MARKIFISYKYADRNVAALRDYGLSTTVRSYVDVLEYHLQSQDHIYKGEQDGESLANFKDSTIQSKLREKIFDSSTTLVFISPGMRETWKSESDQWIPWEIAYSLRESTRRGRTSSPNAVLAVVLPDAVRSYNYFLQENSCPTCKCTTYKTDTLFQIMRDNMFNVKHPQHISCSNHQLHSVFSGEFSYIPSVTWDFFGNNLDKCVERAQQIRENILNYNVCKTVSN